MKLGDKIKKARIESDMTQTELAGTQITRNMLSQIENNNALPSIPTIKYIASKLNIPVGYFFTDDNDDFIFKKMYVIDDIREMFKKKQYRHCIDLCNALNGSDDETEYILANSYFTLAYESFMSGHMKTAANLFAVSLKHANNTVYISNKILQYSVIFLDFIKTFSNNLIKPSFSIVNYSPFTETLMYLNILTSQNNSDDINNIVDIKFKEIYQNHIAAKKFMADGKYNEAEQILSKLLDNELTPFEKYMIIIDMESCYANDGDFKNAYKYSTIKNELYTQMFNN